MEESLRNKMRPEILRQFITDLSTAKAMCKKLRTILFMIFLLQGTSAVCQSMAGAAVGNYSGVDGLRLNPSSMHNSKSYLDIRLFGLGLFVQNNYLYMSKEDYRFSNFFKSGYVWPTHQEWYGPEQRTFYHYSNKRYKNAFVQQEIEGPGAMLIYGRHAFALTTAYRTVVSGAGVPYELANFAYLGMNYWPQQNIQYHDYGPVSTAGMSWGEIGLSYSNVLYARGYHMLSAGVSVKRLLGTGGVYMNARDLDYIIPNDSTIDVRNVDAWVGVSLPIAFDENVAVTSPLFKGKGFGADFGVTYTRLARYHQEQYFGTLCAQQYEDYIYRVGIALIDLGAIRFNNNARLMHIDNRSSYWEHVNHMKITSIGQLLDTISYKFYGDYTSGYAGEKFTLGLPTALSAQFDYHFRPNWYVNASLIMGVPVGRSTIRRPAELTVTPRFESKWFEVNMPVSLYNWQLARLGFSARIFFLTVGTDKLGGFFHMSDFTGLDFYMSVRFFFGKGSCNNRGPQHCGGNESYQIKSK